MRSSFAKVRTSSQHETSTDNSIGWYMPGVHTNTEQSWVQFRKVKQPTYENIPLHGEPDIIHATDILIEEMISTLSTMVRKSVHDFHAQMKKYTTELTERIK